MEAEGARDPLELDRPDLRERHRRSVGRVHHLLAHQDLTGSGVLGDPRRDVHGPAEVVALLAAKDHVNVFLYDGGIVPDPAGIITGGHDNKTGRTVAVREGERLNARALSAMFKQIIANNRAGGWRKLKRER